MFHWKNAVTLLAAATLVILAVGCRKEEKGAARAKELKKEKVSVRERNACERTVKKFLDAAAAKNYRQALEYVDVEEMVRKGREQAATSTATPPQDVERLKDMLVSMLERSSAQAGQITYTIPGSRVSGDTAVVEFEAHKDGELVDKGELALAKRDGQWKLSGSAIRAILPPGVPGPLIKRPSAESQ